MISIAWRNLSHDKIRFAISLAGVAFSVFLILILMGLFRGWNVKLAKYIDNTPADLWVLQKGGDDFFNAVSFLPTSLEGQIQAVAGVKEVHPLIGRQVSFRLNGEFETLYIIGFDTMRKVGGPFKYAEGRELPGDGEIIIDKVFSINKGVKLGDTISILDKNLRVAGIAEGGDLVFVQFAFMALPEARTLFDMRDQVNFYLVKLEESVERDRVMASIESVDPHVSAIPKQAYRENNQKDINDIFLPILAILVFIGFLVGLMVVGLMAYTSTIEKSKEYGILKAIGVPNSFLYKTIFQQSVTIGLFGFVLGGGLAFGTSSVLEEIVPQFATEFAPRDAVVTFFLILLMSVSSSYIPIHRITRIDPATAFKA